MTDDNYPSEWDDEPQPDRLDPRYGDALDPWQPTQAQRALAAELAAAYIARDTGFGRLFLTFCADRDRETSWMQLTLALLELHATTAVGAQGEKLSIARAEGDLDEARRTIIEFGGGPQ